MTPTPAPPAWAHRTTDATAEQLAAVDDKIARLQALQGELQRVVSAACHGRVGECRVIEVLSNHDLCAIEHEPAVALTTI